MKLKYIASFIIILIAGSLFSQNEYKKLTKKFNIEYEINKNTIVNISNIYGDINFETTKDDKITISGVISSVSKMENKAKKRLGQIMIYKSSDSNMISVKTMILKKDFLNDGEDRVDVQYNIKVPVYLKMIIENKFGNINITNHNGKLNINLERGILSANNLLFPETQPLSKLKTKFADVKIKNCNWLNIECSSSNISILQSRSMIIKSDNSKLNLGNCRVVYSNSVKDYYIFKNISKLNMVSKKTKLNIDVLETSIDFKGANHNLTINYIPSNFSDINIENLQGNVNLNIDKDASYKVFCQADLGEVATPIKANIDKVSTKDLEKISGTIGKPKNKLSNVNVTTSYGKIILQN